MKNQPKRIYLEHAAFRFLRFFLQTRDIYFIAGTNSLYVPSRQEKYILYTNADGSKLCRMWTDENNKEYEMTPSEAARAELKKTFPGLRRVGWQSEHVRLFDWRWPMLYGGPTKGEGAYIDLKGAYHQIYSRLWLDTCFPCGYGNMSLTGIAETLQSWKAARNSLIGITAARQTMGVRGFQSFPLQTKNPYLSPGLWATIQAILNELALLAEQRGAIYIATDGYIFPNLLEAQKFEEVLYDVGLAYRKSTGNYEIKGWGVYSVSGKKTKAFDRTNPLMGGNFRSINILDSDYPRRCLNWWGFSTRKYSNQRSFYKGVKQWQMN